MGSQFLLSMVLPEATRGLNQHSTEGTTGVNTGFQVKDGTNYTILPKTLAAIKLHQLLPFLKRAKFSQVLNFEIPRLRLFQQKVYFWSK